MVLLYLLLLPYMYPRMSPLEEEQLFLLLYQSGMNIKNSHHNLKFLTHTQKEIYHLVLFSSISYDWYPTGRAHKFLTSRTTWWPLNWLQVRMPTWGTKYVQSVYRTGSQGEDLQFGWEPFFRENWADFWSLSKVTTIIIPFIYQYMSVYKNILYSKVVSSIWNYWKHIFNYQGKYTQICCCSTKFHDAKPGADS